MSKYILPRLEQPTVLRYQTLEQACFDLYMIHLQAEQQGVVSLNK